MASALRMLAQKAKKRLSTAGQSFVEIDKPTTAYLADGSYAIVANNQKIKIRHRRIFSILFFFAQTNCTFNWVNN